MYLRTILCDHNCFSDFWGKKAQMLSSHFRASLFPLCAHSSDVYCWQQKILVQTQDSRDPLGPQRLLLFIGDQWPPCGLSGCSKYLSQFSICLAKLALTYSSKCKKATKATNQKVFRQSCSYCNLGQHCCFGCQSKGVGIRLYRPRVIYILVPEVVLENFSFKVSEV